MNMANLKAVIPVAGLGMHMLPATKAIPKEMLPIVDKPMIQYIVDEIVAAGIKEIVLVTHSLEERGGKPLRHLLRAGSPAGTAREAPAAGGSAGHLPAGRDHHERASGAAAGPGPLHPLRPPGSRRQPVCGGPAGYHP